MSETVEHIVHENGINEIILHKDDRQVVDDYMAIIETLLIEEIEREEDQPVRILVDLTKTLNVPPFAYITTKGRKILSKHYKDRDKIHVRGILLAKHDEMTIVSLAEALFKLLPVDAKMKPFEGRHRVQAIEWLLADD